jgi:hypothetical protein
MNGDIKLFDQKHAELLKVSGLHENVSCALYFKSDKLDSNLVVSGSETPGAALVFSSVNSERN